MSKSWDKDWMEREAARRRKEERLMRMVRGDLDRRDVDRGLERRRSAQEEVPVFSECAIGYRQWRVDALDQLWPITVAQLPWLPGTNEAVCSRRAGMWTVSFGSYAVPQPPEPGHAAPHERCECGLYAWRRPLDQWGLAASNVVTNEHAMPPVVGAAAFWGDVRAHRDGFRAEKACAVALAYRPDERADVYRVLERVAARYRIALVAFADLEDEARRFGAPLPDSLRPPPSKAQPGWTISPGTYWFSSSSFHVGP